MREHNYDFESISMFRRSIGTHDMISEWDERPFYLHYKNTIACIGSGHFCATYNRRVVNHIPMKYSSSDINNAEREYLDLPVEDGGFLRLSTARGYVYHMGNVAEEWMYKIMDNNQSNNHSIVHLSLNEGYLLKYHLLRKLFTKILRNHRIKPIKVKWFGK